jgi:hypothetical protein
MNQIKYDIREKVDQILVIISILLDGVTVMVDRVVFNVCIVRSPQQQEELKISIRNIRMGKLKNKVQISNDSRRSTFY